MAYSIHNPDAGSGEDEARCNMGSLDEGEPASRKSEQGLGVENYRRALVGTGCGCVFEGRAVPGAERAGSEPRLAR